MLVTDPGNEKSWLASAELVTVFLQLFCFIRVFKIEYLTKAHINDNDDHHISIRVYVLTARTAILLKTVEPSKLSPKLVINLKWKRIKKSEMQILLSKCNKTTRFFLYIFILKISCETFGKQVLPSIFEPRIVETVVEFSCFEFLLRRLICKLLRYLLVSIRCCLKVDRLEQHWRWRKAWRWFWWIAFCWVDVWYQRLFGPLELVIIKFFSFFL